MSEGVTLAFDVHFATGSAGRRELRTGAAPAAPEVPEAAPSRVARLMALAIRFEELVRAGEVDDFADIAALGQVTRARVSQIANLLSLAPDIQEEILNTTCSGGARSAVTERQVREIAAEPDWARQRELWRVLNHAR